MADETKVAAYFVRHGTTELNESNSFRGPLDVPLDDKGMQDAANLGQYFANTEIGSAWNSDRQRTVSTAKAILDSKGIVSTSDPNLRAWNVGYLGGLNKDEHADEIQYFQRHPDEQIPNGESLNEFKKRVRHPILRALHAGVTSGKPSMVVAHSSIIHEVGAIIHKDHSAALVKPGGVVAVTHDGKGFKAAPILRPETKKAGFGS